MKITNEFIPVITLEEFAEKHELEMVVHERELPIGDPCRFYASFKNAEVKDGSMLISNFGNGATPQAAIKEYAPKIQLKTIVIDAFRKNRKEIHVPRLK